MATEQQTASDLRARIAALEDEHAERVAQAHAALAAEQDRAYWLDRWGLDLNALMRRRGAAEGRALLRTARSMRRFVINTRRRVKRLPARLDEARATMAQEAGDREIAERERTGAFSRSLSPDPLRATPVTDLLYERLTAADVEAIERSAGDAIADGVDRTDRRRILLSLGVHHGVAGVLERTGLTRAAPPEEVHSMGHGPLAAGGSPYYADLVTDGFAIAGLPFEAGQRCLDFGCSSARVVRVLQAAFPDCEWHGCDPIPDAIEWARANIEGAAFELSPERPPLVYDDASFDRVFAISIWSHFSAAAALAWLHEMRRIVKPGGALLLTTHGHQTIAHDHRTHRRTDEQLMTARATMYEQGFWFANEFGEAGDHGVANVDWGTAFLTPEWLLTKATPYWRVSAFAPGRVEDNQDLYVLERR